MAGGDAEEEFNAFDLFNGGRCRALAEGVDDSEGVVSGCDGGDKSDGVLPRLRPCWESVGWQIFTDANGGPVLNGLPCSCGGVHRPAQYVETEVVPFRAEGGDCKGSRVMNREQNYGNGASCG